MEQVFPSRVCGSLEQVYLVERDAGLLCRILGLYASRGIDVKQAAYEHAAQDVMTLKVSVLDENPDLAETMRVLVDKAASFVGVIAAALQPCAAREQRYPGEPLMKAASAVSPLVSPLFHHSFDSMTVPCPPHPS